MYTQIDGLVKLICCQMLAVASLYFRFCSYKEISNIEKKPCWHNYIPIDSLSATDCLFQVKSKSRRKLSTICMSMVPRL